MAYTYDYPRPALSVDCVVFRARDLLLIERARAPYEGSWALPGGFLDVGETLLEGAARELREETGLVGVELEQIGAFGDPGRDPREHVVSVAFWGEVGEGMSAVAGDDARRVRWWPMDALPELAFDHDEILTRAQAKR